MRQHLLIAFVVVVCMCAESVTPRLVRFIHAISNGPNCDVWLNNKLAFPDLPVGSMTEYMEAHPMSGQDAIMVQVFHAGTMEPYWGSGIVGVMVDESATYGATCYITGIYSNNTLQPLMWAGTSSDLIIEPRSDTALLRMLFLGPTPQTQVLTKVYMQKKASPKSTLAALLTQAENNPYSVLLADRYQLSVPGKDTDLLTFPFAVEGGKAYTLVLLGNMTTTKDYTYPLSAILVHDYNSGAPGTCPSQNENPPRNMLIWYILPGAGFVLGIISVTIICVVARRKRNLEYANIEEPKSVQYSSAPKSPDRKSVV